MTISNNIFENKPQFIPTWNLSIEIEPGQMLNDSWATDSQLDFSTWELSLYYDSNLLFGNTAVISKQTINVDVTDDEKMHLLSFELKFSKGVQGQMIKLLIRAEDHDITVALMSQDKCYQTANGEVKFGSEYMGEPGKQCFQIQTPIYRWFFENEKLVIKY